MPSTKLLVWICRNGKSEKLKHGYFCENLDITIKTTGTESPWSNGLVEPHNAIMGEGVSKVVEDTRCSLEVALAWAVSAKNALQNLHGFSPNQVVFGRNPNFLHDILLALEAKTNSEIVAENLNAMHSAKKAFIASEAFEKLRRALRHNIRASGNVKYVSGDSTGGMTPTNGRALGKSLVRMVNRSLSDMGVCIYFLL